MQETMQIIFNHFVLPYRIDQISEKARLLVDRFEVNNLPVEEEAKL